MLALKRRIAVVIALAFAVLAVVQFFYFPSRNETMQLEALRAKAIALSELTAYGVASSLEFDAEDAAAEHLQGPARDSDLELIAVFAPNGKVFAAFDRHGAGIPEAPPVPGDTRTREEPHRLRVVTPIALRASEPGVLLVDFSSRYIEREVARSRRAAAVIGLCILVLGVMVAVWIRRSLQRIETLLNENSSARERAESASRAKSEFLANTSHEIRTPMNAVLGMVEVLLTSGLADKQRRIAETIQRSGRTLLAILDDLLDFSKIESGQMRLEAVPVDIHTLAEDVVDRFTARARGKGLDLALCVEPGVPSKLVGDGYRIEQVLSNLIGNAVKFTEEGTVSVRVSLAQREDDTARLHFEVQDSGVGIDPLVRSRLFLAFSQADSSTTRVYGGTGLGLAICRRLVEMMSGQIGVESEPGVGSCFWFEIDLPVSPAAADPVPPRLEGLRALLVDENETTLSALEGYLSEQGALTVRASSGATALELARRMPEDRPFDLVVGNERLRDMDGVELLDSLAVLGQPVKAVLMSAALDSRHPPARPELEHVSKPLRRAALIGAVMRALGRSEAPGPSIPMQLPDPKRARPTRVFAAEDNAANQEVLRMMLEHLGCQVEIGDNGQVAVDALRGNHDYDVVLMDCQMPVLDGYQAVSEIRKHEAARGAPRVPVVAITAHALSGERERVLAAGMDDYLTKPLGMEALRIALARWATPRAPTSDPALDLDTVAVLRSLATERKPSFFVDVVTKYAQDAEAHLSGLRQAVERDDREALRRHAHALKGSSRTVGASEAGALAERLETASHDPEACLDAELVGALAAAIAHAVRALGAAAAA